MMQLWNQTQDFLLCHKFAYVSTQYLFQCHKETLISATNVLKLIKKGP